MRGGEEAVEINIAGTAKEIAALVLELQGRQERAPICLDGAHLAQAVQSATRDIFQACGCSSKIRTTQ